MLIKVETDRIKIELAEQSAHKTATDIGETASSFYFFDTNSKSAMSFTRLEEGVQIRVAQTMAECNFLLDEMEREVIAEGAA